MSNNNNKIPGVSEKQTLPIGVGNKELSNFDCFSILYDAYADKVLGFIMAHNYSKPEGEKILVTMLLSSFDIEAVDTPDGKPAEELMAFTMNPVGLTMRLKQHKQDA